MLVPNNTRAPCVVFVHLHRYRANMLPFSLTGGNNTVRAASKPGSRPGNGDSVAEASLGTALYYPS
jgi:hypothetical protein